jgi:hypothetical protein
MSQETERLSESIMKLHHQRRGSNRVRVASLVGTTASAALVAAVTIMQQDRSDRNERQEKTIAQRDDKGSGSGEPELKR